MSLSDDGLGRPLSSEQPIYFAYAPAQNQTNVIGLGAGWLADVCPARSDIGKIKRVLERI